MECFFGHPVFTSRFNMFDLGIQHYCKRSEFAREPSVAVEENETKQQSILGKCFLCIGSFKY